MNKVILMGRLTRDPDVRYSQSDPPLAVARFSLAIDRRHHRRDGESNADFINCVAFGKNGEFIEKYFRKGQMVSVVGRLSVRNWEDQSGQKRVTTEVIIDEQYFAESKSSFESRNAYSSSFSEPQPFPQSQPEPQPFQRPQPQPAQNNNTTVDDSFYTIDEHIDEEDLPF